MTVQKRIITYFLLLLMAMNTIGYFTFLVHVRNQVAIASIEKIQTSENEPGGDLIIKLPLTIPYVLESQEYGNASGHFSYEGKIYQALKQKLHNDTLYLVCIHDELTTEASNKVIDLARSFAGDGDQRGMVLKAMVAFAKYCVTETHDLQSAQTGWTLKCEYNEYTVIHEQTSDLRIFHPPELLT